MKLEVQVSIFVDTDKLSSERVVEELHRSLGHLRDDYFHLTADSLNWRVWGSVGPVDEATIVLRTTDVHHLKIGHPFGNAYCAQLVGDFGDEPRACGKKPRDPIHIRTAGA